MPEVVVAWWNCSSKLRVRTLDDLVRFRLSRQQILENFATCDVGLFGRVDPASVLGPARVRGRRHSERHAITPTNHEDTLSELGHAVVSCVQDLKSGAISCPVHPLE